MTSAEAQAGTVYIKATGAAQASQEPGEEQAAADEHACELPPGRGSVSLFSPFL